MLQWKWVFAPACSPPPHCFTQLFRRLILFWTAALYSTVNMSYLFYVSLCNNLQGKCCFIFYFKEFEECVVKCTILCRFSMRVWICHSMFICILEMLQTFTDPPLALCLCPCLLELLFYWPQHSFSSSISPLSPPLTFFHPSSFPHIASLPSLALSPPSLIYLVFPTFLAHPFTFSLVSSTKKHMYKTMQETLYIISEEKKKQYIHNLNSIHILHHSFIVKELKYL